MRLSKKITGIAMGLIAASSFCVVAVAGQNFFNNTFALTRGTNSYTCSSIHFGMNDADLKGTANLASGSIQPETYNDSIGTCSGVTVTKYVVETQAVYYVENQGIRLSSGSKNSTLKLTLDHNVIGCDIYAVGWKNDTSKLKVNDGSDLSIEEGLTQTSGTEVVTYKKYHYDFSETNVLTLAATKRLVIGDIALRTTSEYTPSEPPVSGEWHDATMTKGTTASDATINGKTAIKIGKSSAPRSGTLTISVPKNTTQLKFYAVAWNGEGGASNALTLSGVAISPLSITLTANSNIAGSLSDFTIDNESLYEFSFTLTNVTANSTLTITSVKRAVIWGPQYYN